MFRSPLFSDLVTLRNEVERLTDQAFGGTETRSRRLAGDTTWSSPIPIDVYSTNDHAVIIAAVPGLAPEDLDLSINHNTVTISGAIKNAADADDAKHATWYVSELTSGSFRRSVTLPFPVDADQTTAVAEHGIVRITLPKAATARSHKITVSTSRDEALAASNPAA